MKRTYGMMAVASALVLSWVSLPATVRAQSGAVVQTLPSAAAVDRLNSNLAKLSRAPQDVDALLGAGQAALDLGDVQAANGFFTRANIVNPRLGAAKLGLAVVELALKQPQEAATNFDAAEALGQSSTGYLADRGLAYDLTGQQAKAQHDYQAALQANAGDAKARLRYAVSLGISGHVTEADRLLEQALRTGDREAWRFRAFIYAMNGRVAEARNMTQSVMPKGLADALDPYMVRVSLLTPAQKAAAAHYGDFPANVLRMTPSNQPVVVAAAAPPPPAAEPAKRDNGKKSRNGDRDSAKTVPPVQTAALAPQPSPSAPKLDIPPPPPPSEPVQVARATPQPDPMRISRADLPPPPPPIVTTPAQSAQRFEAPTRTTTAPAIQQPSVPVRTTPAPTIQPTTPPVRTATAPAFEQPAPQVQPTPKPAVSTSAPAPQRSLASAMSQLDVPAAEQQKVAAVDLNALAKAKADKAKKDAEAKAKAERDAKAKEEAELKKKLKANPSRVWVQIAAGKNTSALAFDLRRFRKNYADAMGDEAGWYFPWGATNRLLIGPYRKEEAARDAISAIKKAGGDAFLWESEAGDEILKIGDK